MYTCEKCGTIVTVPYGSGRFCSEFCARSYVGSRNPKGFKNVICVKCGNTYKINKHASAKKHICERCKTKRCKICNNIVDFRNKSGYCEECIRHSPKLREYRANRSRNASAHVKNRKYWMPRNQISYAEKFWIQVLNNNKISFDHDHTVKVDNKHWYFLDFYIEKNGKKIDLEIDGKQHTYPDRLASDEVRDKFLVSNEYLVYRVAWNEINSEEGKNMMKTNIDNFLAWYNKI